MNETNMLSQEINRVRTLLNKEMAEKKKLEKERDNVTTEIEELTSSLFMEANNMVRVNSSINSNEY